MLDEKELKQVREYVIKILPDLLRQDPEVATAIEGILAQQFPRRDEFARLLDEFTGFRRETKDNFDKVDQRFDKVDDQLGKVDERLGKAEKTQLGMRRDIAKLHHGQEMILKRMDSQDMWLNLQTGGLWDKKGHSLEDMFAVALSYGLKNPHLSPDKIQLRQNLVDTNGLIFKAGFSTEIDLIVEDDKLTVFEVFEVKTTPKVSEVDIFALKVELVTLQNPDKQVRGILISPGQTEAVQQRCAEHGLVLVGGPRPIS